MGGEDQKFRVPCIKSRKLREKEDEYRPRSAQASDRSTVEFSTRREFDAQKDGEVSSIEHLYAGK
jgi:hypothetical protein